MSKGATLLAVPVLAATLAVAGCQFPDGTGERGRRGSGGTPPTQDVRVAGIWDGITVGAASVQMTALVQGGRFMMVGDGSIYDGTYPPTNNSNINVSANVYAINGPLGGPVTISGGIDRIFIQFAQPVGVNLQMEEAIYESGGSLSRLEDHWTFQLADAESPHLTLAIGPDGRFNDMDADGCVYQGDGSNQGLFVIDSDINLYRVRFTLAGDCGPFLGAAYTGLATLFPNNNRLFLMAVNGSHSIFYIFERN